MSEWLIEADDLVKQYRVGEEIVTAVDRVSLKIARGEFLAIMGASGSGKSTFMNMIGFLDTPTSGRLRIDGACSSTLDHDALAAFRNRSIGFIFQQFNLLSRTTALANVALPLIYAGVPRAERQERAREKLVLMGLADRLEHTPARLSGGQQQRVAIARALVVEPAILLADEPTGALDSRTSDEIMAIIQQLHRGGITVILVTHDAEVARCAARRIRFHDGRIIEDEPVRDPRRSEVR